jgi:hypothetical protein
MQRFPTAQPSSLNWKSRTIGLLDEGGTEDRRETMLSTIHEQGKLTPELRAKIGGALATSFR